MLNSDQTIAFERLLKVSDRSKMLRLLWESSIATKIFSNIQSTRSPDLTAGNRRPELLEKFRRMLATGV